MLYIRKQNSEIVNLLYVFLSLKIVWLRKNQKPKLCRLETQLIDKQK